MKSIPVYIDATPKDNEMLTETAITSKKIWGYSDDLINNWRSELEVSKEYIKENKVVKVFHNDMFIGFFGLKLIQNNDLEIDHLWIKPENIKKGYGRAIFQFIFNFMKLNGNKRTILIAEPNAKGFYDKMGGIIIGQFESQISGRFLDIYEFTLKT